MIRESQNWKNMEVPLTKKFEEKEILTLTPSEFKISEEVRCNNFETEELLEFVRKNNKTLSENINYFPKSLLDLENACFTTLVKDGQILSFNLATILPIRVKDSYNLYLKDQKWEGLISKKTLLYGYTNYLCTKEKDKGYGFQSIQATLNYGRDRGVLCGYYIVTSPKTSNYVELKNWSRPLNFGITKSVGFNFPSLKKKNDKSELRNDLHYKIKLDSSLKFEKCGTKDLRNYLELVKDGTFVFYPNQNSWNQWISGFNTFALSENGKIISIGSILITETLMTQKNKILKYCNIVLLVGDPRILGFLMEEGKKLGAGIATGYQIGTINAEMLKELKCFNMGSMYLEFYNTSLVHKTEGIMTPIF